MGEVTGNWVNDGVPRPAQGPERTTSIAAPRLTAPAGGEIRIPVTVQGAVGKDIIAYQFELKYDPSVIQPHTDLVDLAGTASRGLSAVANVTEPGLVRVVVYGVAPIDGNDVLLNLRFKAIGMPGSASPLTWEHAIFNEGDPGTFVTDGQVELVAAAPAQAAKARR